jgi:hypothetical protein
MEYLQIEDNFEIQPNGALLIYAFGGNGKGIIIKAEELDVIHNISLVQRREFGNQEQQ